jgi:hypothetical protein
MTEATRWSPFVLLRYLVVLHLIASVAIPISYKVLSLILITITIFEILSIMS